MKKLLILLTVVIVVCSFASIANAIEYSYTELLPSGWNGVFECDINDSGKAVCYGFNNSKLSTFYYENGSYSEIAPPTGMTEVWATGINNNGDIVGNAIDEVFNDMPFVYDRSSYTEIQTDLRSVSLFDINDNGIIIGRGYDDRYKGLVYSGGSYTSIKPAGWLDVQIMTGINASGEVVGWGNSGTGVKGFLYSEGVYTELLDSGWSTSSAEGINDNGDVVGYGGNSSTGIATGFLYSDGNYIDIALENWSTTLPRDINNSGVIAGDGYDGTTWKGFVYDGETYTELLPEGWTWIDEIFSINENGTIIGSGRDATGTTKGFIATPVVPEPISSTLFIIGGAVLGFRRFRKRA